MTQEELDNKIEEAFLENTCNIPTSLTYSVFKRVAEYFYNEGRKDTLEKIAHML